MAIFLSRRKADKSNDYRVSLKYEAKPSRGIRCVYEKIYWTLFICSTHYSINFFIPVEKILIENLLIRIFFPEQSFHRD